MNRYALVFLLGLISLVNATVVANSLDYEDVVSAICYSYVKGEAVELVYPDQPPSAIISGLSNDSVFLVKSEEKPVYVGLESSLNANDIEYETFQSADVYETNIELAGKSGAENFIVTDPSYSHNVVSLLPYAKRTNSFILFADSENSESLKNFLETHTVSSLLLFGNLDDEVKEAVNSAGVNYETIHVGDKYEDNIALLEKYYALGANRQVLFTDGNILEVSIIDGSFPVVLVSYTIPDSTFNFVRNKVNSGEVSVGVLIGSDYTNPVYDLKRRTEESTEKDFSVLVKFAKLVPAGNGGQKTPLDIYELPASELKMQIKDITFNKNTEQLEVVLENTGEVLAYSKFTGNIYLDGGYLQSYGEDEYFEVGEGEEIGMRYDIADVEEGTLTTNITVHYSSTKSAIEKGLLGEFTIARVDYEDNSQLEVSTAEFDTETNTLSLKVANTGEVPAYFKVEATYILPEELPTKVEGEKVYTVDPGSAYTAQLAPVVSGVEGYTGMNMTAKIHYGSREAFMEKTSEKNVNILEEKAELEMDMTIIFAVILLIIIVIVAAYFLFMRKKK